MIAFYFSIHLILLDFSFNNMSVGLQYNLVSTNINFGDPMKTIITSLLLLTASWNTLADSSHFSIQIAATQDANLARFREVTEFGTLSTEETGNGLIRVKIGSFKSRAEAELVLQNIQAKGFTEAFITSPANQTASLPETSIASVSANAEPQKDSTAIPESSPAWSRLSEEQKRNVVYLDGVLHLRVNGEFIPLSSY